MTNHDGLLDFLTDGLVGRERDAVTRAFYSYASGDPNSEPVGISVLLTACMRQLSKVPEKLESAASAYQKIVVEARELEKGMIARVNASNTGVVTEFRDETRRAVTAWTETIREAMRVGQKAQDMANEMKPIIATAQQIALDLQALKGDLKVHAESAKTMADDLGAIKAIHQENRGFFQSMTREVRANWTTMGLLAGIILASIFSLLSWWGAALAFAGVIVLLQWLARR